MFAVILEELPGMSQESGPLVKFVQLFRLLQSTPFPLLLNFLRTEIYDVLDLVRQFTNSFDFVF